jgi:hypothetical protein
MFSYALNTPEIDFTLSQAFISALALTLPFTFNRMISNGRPAATSFVQDQCTRLTPKYNSNYNLYKPSPKDLKPNYSSYPLGELLYNNRLPFSLMLLL